MIISHDEFKTTYLFGKEDLFDGIEDTAIDTLLEISEEIVKTDLNLSTLPSDKIYQTLVAYYTIHSVSTKAVIDKESRSAYKDEYDRLINKLRTPPIGITITDFEDEDDSAG